jgi:hypothetical protein
VQRTYATRKSLIWREVAAVAQVLISALRENFSAQSALHPKNKLPN